MSNQVTITSDTCTLEIHGEPISDLDPPIEFSSGSFKGAVDERRVALVYLAIPFGGRVFSLRFEFTDPQLAAVDMWGNPVYLTDEGRISPYQEVLGAVVGRQGNPDVNK